MALTLSILPDGSAGSVAQLFHMHGGKPEVVDRAGAFRCGSNVTCGVATVTNMDPTKQHNVRVLFRRGMWEVYINDILAQTFMYGGKYPLPEKGLGRVGVVCTGDASAE